MHCNLTAHVTPSSQCHPILPMSPHPPNVTPSSQCHPILPMSPHPPNVTPSPQCHPIPPMSPHPPNVTSSSQCHPILPVSPHSYLLFTVWSMIYHFFCDITCSCTALPHREWPDVRCVIPRLQHSGHSY